MVMKNRSDRRTFLRNTGLLSLGLFSGQVSAADRRTSMFRRISNDSEFNMSGYAAPPLDKVRIGIVGLGMRGPGAVRRMSYIEGVEIKALCDLIPERTEKARELLKDTPHNPHLYSGKPYSWKEMCERDDIDLIYVCTPWSWHTPMAVYAMEQGKHAAIEVPAAVTLDECWQLVETSEKTKRHCMMLENCCYDFFELMTLNMARKGFFGEIVHAEGAYIHNLVELNFKKEGGYQDMWRLKQNFRNGNLYPTHGLGPVCQIMNINRGDQMDYLTSMSSEDFTMGAHARMLAEDDSFFNSYASKDYRGNMNTTVVKTRQGRTIMIQHDVSSERPYSRIHLVSGTKAMARKWPDSKISKGHGWYSDEEMKEIEEKYTPELVKEVGDLAREVGGHGGMDFIMDWRLIYCLRNGLPLDQDVYDAALWSSISPLSEWSVANRSASVNVPDFTRGNWKTNLPVSFDS